jgi:uncharacterized protein (TIGR03435 family)
MMSAFRLSIALAVAALTVIGAQEPAFEVASVRPNKDAGLRINVSVPGEVTLSGVTLDFLITGLAFNVDFRLAQVKFDFDKISKDLLDTRFDVRAKGPSADNRAMLRTLLKERFGLRYHTELRQIPLYAVVVKEAGKLGPWLKPSQLNCAEHARQLSQAGGGSAAPPCLGSRERRFGVPVQRFAGTMDELVLHVVQPSLRRPVMNATGLAGNFEWAIAVGVEEGSIFADLEDQLGLKIESRKGPYEVVVIDSVQMPTPN